MNSQEPEAPAPLPESTGAEVKQALADASLEGIEEMETDQQPGELEQLRQRLEEATAREAENLDGWQRARAELDNARKRFRREQEQTWTVAQADTLARVLPVVDDMERATETLPAELADHPWIEGILLIQRKLGQLLVQAGVEPVEAEGQEFDPFAHQAVTHEPSEDVPAGHVIAELQKGYRIGDRILRHSMVRVSSGPPQYLEPEPEPVLEPAQPDESQEARDTR